MSDLPCQVGVDAAQARRVLEEAGARVTLQYTGHAREGDERVIRQAGHGEVVLTVAFFAPSQAVGEGE